MKGSISTLPLLLLVSAWFPVDVTAFSTTCYASKSKLSSDTGYGTIASPSRSSSLAMSTVSLRNYYEDDYSYRAILIKARECAFSEDSSALEAQRFLWKILELESGCASGTALDLDVCDTNVIELSEIVAHLRQKASQHQQASLSDASAVVTMGSLASVLVTMAFFSKYQWDPEVTPFTFDEWVWAVKGGYFNTMVMHFVRNGGL